MQHANVVLSKCLQVATDSNTVSYVTRQNSPSMTSTQILADLLVGDIDGFVASRRAQSVSWRQIAADLAAATDNRVQVTRETLRNWYPQWTGHPTSPPGVG